MIRTILTSLLLLLTACTITHDRNPLHVDSRDKFLFGDTIGLDHVLIWSQDHTVAETYLTQLGFRLTELPGDYGAGIANKLIRFENLSFMEFLWLSDPEMTRSEAPEEYTFASTRNGSNAFGFQVTDIDSSYAALEAASLHPLQPGSETYDFDGPDGPLPPETSRWRVMFLQAGALPGNPFFVDYNLSSDATVPRSDQPNGAKRISSIWILVNEAELAAEKYKKAGFRIGRPIALPGVGKGIALDGGDAEILLVVPGNEIHRSRPSQYGEHVVGISVEVKSLSAVRKLLEARLEHAPPQFTSVFGTSVRPAALDELGLHIEFHQ